MYTPSSHLSPSCLWLHFYQLQSFCFTVERWKNQVSWLIMKAMHKDAHTHLHMWLNWVRYSDCMVFSFTSQGLGCVNKYFPLEASSPRGRGQTGNSHCFLSQLTHPGRWGGSSDLCWLVTVPSFSQPHNMGILWILTEDNKETAHTAHMVSSHL